MPHIVSMTLWYEILPRNGAARQREGMMTEQYDEEADRNREKVTKWQTECRESEQSMVYGAELTFEWPSGIAASHSCSRTCPYFSEQQHQVLGDFGQRCKIALETNCVTTSPCVIDKAPVFFEE